MLVNGSRLTVHKFKKTVNRKSKGFTLIELLVVISIIAILVAAATVSWTQAQKKARDSKRKSDLKSVQQAFELYFEEYNSYPADDDSGHIQCHDSSNTVITWGGEFTCNITGGERTYMNPIPIDPKGTNSYFYDAFFSKTVNGKDIYLTYQLNAELENTNDPDFCRTQIDCVGDLPIPILPCIPQNSGTNLSYCVIQP